jgi:UDP-N-acetylglucosamine 2-epimerase (non-hydrolysing)
MATTPVKLALVAAARPNFMKIAPLLRTLEARGLDVTLVHTGQHYDDSMSGSFFRDLDIRPPDVHLASGSGSHASVTGAVMLAFETWLDVHPMDAVVVVGDVNSTLAAALVASKAAIPVAHVEAGLRSRDRRMPEEINRICTDHVSDWLFTTSEDANDNLVAEGVDPGRVFLVGNVMIDTLLHNRSRANIAALERWELRPGSYTLVTLHRPSNVDNLTGLSRLVDVLRVIAVDRPVVFPVHPRTRPLIEEGARDVPSGLHFVDPLGYLDFLALMDHAALVITDSGGVQEETTVLGVPCLTVRETTERPITITEGTNRLVGTSPSAILDAYRSTPVGRLDRRPPLWDGKAAERIADVLAHVSPPLEHLRHQRFEG